MRFIPNNERVQKEMLAELGLTSMEQLFASIPSEARLDRALAIAPGMAEADQLETFRAIAAKNKGAGANSFLGAGSYDHFIPLTADSLIQRAEFFTAYTPYQPEVSQGTLQSIFEFQSFVCHLTGMEVANASVYDGASATAEAVLMADRAQRGRNKIILAGSLHPNYQQVIRTYTANLELELVEAPVENASGRLDAQALAGMLDDSVICVVVQQPNFFGVVEDLESLAEAAHKAGALLVTSITEAMSLAVLKSPGDCGADIVAGEAQSFGVPMYFGGPFLGFMATKDAFKRQMPGRIAGQTVDEAGQRGYVLTLATREQHIRREKATSNICTNQNLVMMMAVMYLTLMGREGLKEAAGQNIAKMAYFKDQISKVPGFSLRYSGPNFNEVTLTCPKPAAEIVAACTKKNLLAGYGLGTLGEKSNQELLVAVTENKTRTQIDELINALREVSA